MPRLLQRLRRALAVEPGEGPIVAWAAMSLFLIESASVAVSNAADTLFLKRVGIEYLPGVFLLNSVLLTATTFGAGRLAVRFDQRYVLTATFITLALVLSVLWVLVVGEVTAAATILVLASKQIDVIALLMFWTIVTGLMTSRQGKRLVALMTAGGTLGTIFGSFSSGFLGRLFGIPSLLAIAATIFAVTAVVSVPLGRSAPVRLYRTGVRTLPPGQQRLGGLWRQSSLFRVLVCTSFLAGTLGPMLYFEFSRAADLATRTADGEQRLLVLYGLLRGWINVGVLAVQIGGSAFLFRRIGVPLSAALAPAAYLLGFAGLGWRFGLPTAMPAAMGTSVLDHTVDDPAQRILSALLPMRIRTAATSLIQGPAKRAGAALGSLLILAAVTVADPAHIPLVAIPIAGLWLVLALSLWRNYPNLLLEAASVRRTEPEDGESAASVLDPTTRRMLQQNLEGEDAGLCRAACGLFAEAPSEIAVDALVHALGVAPAANRPALVETLERVLADPAAGSSAGAKIRTNLVQALKSSTDLGTAARATLLHVLGRVCYRRTVTADVRALLEQASDAAEPAVRTAAVIARLRAGAGNLAAADFDDAIASALAEDDDDAHRVALAELRLELMRGDRSDPAWARRLAMLTDRLHHQNTGAGSRDRASILSVRRRVVAALADIASVHGEAVAASAPAVIALADDGDADIRAAVLRFIGNAGLTDYAGLLAERMSSRNTAEAKAARSALESFGPRAAEALLHALRHGGRHAREVVPVMLREIRVDEAVLRTRIDREIERSRRLIVLLGVLEASEVSRLVVQRIRERVDESLHAALELLAAILGEERIARVCRSLGRAWNVRDRAVLLEALEALLPPPERERFLPLLEDQSPQRLAASAAKALGEDWPTFEEALEQAIATRDTLTTALIAATVGHSLLARVAPGLDVDAALRIFSDDEDVAAGEGDRQGTAPSDSGQGNPMLTPVEKMLHLRALDLFEGLTTHQLSELARVVREVTVAHGETIVAEGEFDDRMYFIVDGTVRIDRGGQTVAELGPRDFFGEMAVFDGETRSATATAVGQVRLLRLTRNDLFEVMEDQPAIGIGICQILVRRVRNMLDELGPTR